LGVDVEATPLYVKTIEELASRPSRTPDREPALAPLVRRALTPLARLAGRRAAARRKHSAIEDDPLHAAVRRLRREGSEVVAGPWLGSETAELLYWIPFLRWVQTATYGLRDRLTVVSRPDSAWWYEGLGTQHVAAERLESAADAVCLSPKMVEERRAELSAGKLSDQFLRRRLEFARLAVPEGLSTDLPAEFVATIDPELGAVLGSLGPVVRVDVFDRPQQGAALARARGFVGPYGVEAILAVLSGVPAVVLRTGNEPFDELQVISSFLSRPPFGRLHLVEPGEARDRALRLLGAAVEAPAGV
jgi:hypothetical protein